MKFKDIMKNEEMETENTKPETETTVPASSASEAANEKPNNTSSDAEENNKSEGEFVFKFLFSVVVNGKEQDEEVSVVADTEGEALKKAIRKVSELSNEFNYKDILSKVEN